MVTLLVAVKLFQTINCRIGCQLTSDEGWNTELMNSRSESNTVSWKDWFFTCRQGKVARRPRAPRIVLEFAIKTRYVPDSWKTSCCPWVFSGVLENSLIVLKLFIFELLIALNIQESRINNVLFSFQFVHG